MKIIYVIYALLLAMAAVTLYVIVSPSPENAAGIAHETFAGVRMGGDGAARLSTIGWAPYWFQMLLITLVGACLYLGVAEKRRDKSVLMSISAVTVFVLIVWHLTYSAYINFLETGDPMVIFGFPLASNLSLWGTWIAFGMFDLLFVLGFRKFIYPEEDEAAFNQLIVDIKEGRVSQDWPNEGAQ